MSILRQLTQGFNNIRDAFWNYPDTVLFDRRSWVNSFKRFYQSSVPASHFILVFMLFAFLFVTLSGQVNSLLSVDSNIFIEGVVMGADPDGKPVKLNRINPLINSTVQLEKDLNELIYEPLIKVDNDGSPTPVLADYSVLEQGSRYQFKLKEGVKWHDGQELTVDDVTATLNLLKALDDNPATSTLFSRAANKIEIDKSADDPYVFQFVVKNSQIIPGFFEAISFKILPAHLLQDMTPMNITQSDPYLNRTPVGTGPFKLTSAKADTVELSANGNYWGNAPKIERIKFKLFATEEAASSALKTGQIHGLSSISLSLLTDLAQSQNIATIKSNTIYNQYWSLYFNLAEGGPVALKDLKVRQAIAAAINKTDILKAMQDYGEAAKGPIPPNSFAYTDPGKNNFEITRAVTLLNEAGFVPGEDGIRVKDGQKLSLELILINNSDRLAVAEVIKENLKAVGIEVIVQPTDLRGVVEDHIFPRIYDLMLYGVQTLIDPDRYELFHSSQATAPGLNISSYVSDEKRTQIVEGKTTRVSAVDDDLNDARRIVDEKARTKRYDDFQKIIAAEVPQVFLFYPQEFYLVNRRVKNVTLGEISSIEQRFDSVTEWEIKITE